jgi:galactokinase
MVDVVALRAIGLSATAANEKAKLFARARAALDQLVLSDVSSQSGAPENSASRARDVEAFWVPGRIEFLGKHTDYAGGHSLLCTVERGICILASPRTDRRLRIVDAARSDDIVDTTISADAIALSGHWSTYPITVARRIAQNFGGPLVGADIAFVSDLPIASGLSSSSALVVATFLALWRVNRLEQRPAFARNLHTSEDIAGYLGAVENGLDFGELIGSAGVGTFGGSEDHTAILCSRADALVDYGFCPVRFQRVVPLPADYEFVIASSGIVAEKIGAARDAYNRASLATQRVLALWREETRRTDATLAEALDSSRDAFARIRRMLSDATVDHIRPLGSTRLTWDEAQWLTHRVDQFNTETQLIPQVGHALRDGALFQLGMLVDRSQSAAETMLGNQIPETIWLARAARFQGAVAASAFGAGFGGSVWALVRSDMAEEFRQTWSSRYAEEFPLVATNAEFFRTRAGPPAGRVTPRPQVL